MEVQPIINWISKHRLVAFFFLLVVLVLILIPLRPVLSDAAKLSSGNTKSIKDFIDSFGVFGPIIIILLVVLRTAIPVLPIPTPLFLITNGLVFGFWWGAVISWIAHICAAVYAFYFARFFGDVVRRRMLEYRNVSRYRTLINDKGPQAVLVSRLVMVAPFNIVSYLAGLTEMNFLKYVLATAVGVIPESVIFSYVGAYLGKTRLSTRTTLELSLILLAGLVLFWLVKRLWARTIEKRSR